IVGAAGGGIFKMLNPLLVASYAFLLGANYLLAVVVMVGLSVPYFLLAGLSSLINLIPIPFVTRVAEYAISCYVPFVAVRVLGLLIYTHGDKVGYGVDGDYRVPIMPGVEPRGVLPD